MHCPLKQSVDIIGNVLTSLNGRQLIFVSGIFSQSIYHCQDPSPRFLASSLIINSATPVNEILCPLIMLLSLFSPSVYSGSVHSIQSYTWTNKLPPCNEESLIPAAFTPSPCTHSSIMPVPPPPPPMRDFVPVFSSVYAALMVNVKFVATGLHFTKWKEKQRTIFSYQIKRKNVDVRRLCSPTLYH